MYYRVGGELDKKDLREGAEKCLEEEPALQATSSINASEPLEGLSIHRGQKP